LEFTAWRLGAGTAVVHPDPQGRVGTRRRSEKNDSSKVFALSHQGHLADLEESYGTRFTSIEGLRIALDAPTKMSPWTAVALHVPPFVGGPLVWWPPWVGAIPQA